MIEKLKKQIADLEKSLADKKQELRETIMKGELEKLSAYVNSCCRIRSRYCTAYLFKVSGIEVDDYDDGFIDISATRVIVIEKDVPGVSLDEDCFLYNPETDVVEKIEENKIWELIGLDIKKICLG